MKEANGSIRQSGYTPVEAVSDGCWVPEADGCGGTECPPGGTMSSAMKSASHSFHLEPTGVSGDLGAG